MIGGFAALSLVAALDVGVPADVGCSGSSDALQRLGAYTLERKISEGGMATIYLARHALLKRPTAIKILKKHVATDEFIHRFEREVQLASQLLHPNTVRDLRLRAHAEGEPYYVMEYLDGVTLAELVRRHRAAFRPVGRSTSCGRSRRRCARRTCAGLVHRDVKPENVMLCRRGEDDVVKLLDFGLVKNLEGARDARHHASNCRSSARRATWRRSGMTQPSDVDARSDIYALGAVGYFLLTGRPVFEGDDTLEISNQVLHTPAPRVAATVEVPEATGCARRGLPRQGPRAPAAECAGGRRCARSPRQPPGLDTERRGGMVERLSAAGRQGGEPGQGRRERRRVTMNGTDRDGVDDASPAMTFDIVSDVVWPWRYIGKRAWKRPQRCWPTPWQGLKRLLEAS